MKMKSFITLLKDLRPHLAWIFSGTASFIFAYILSFGPILIIQKIIGGTIMVQGTEHITEDYLFGYVFVPIFGLVLGLFQYLLLKRKLAKMGWWIVATAAGWGLGWLALAWLFGWIDDAFGYTSGWYLLAFGSVLGFFLGLAQWFVLRKQVRQAGWWILANMLGLGLTAMFFGSITSLFDTILTTALPCLITDLLLWWYARQPA